MQKESWFKLIDSSNKLIKNFDKSNIIKSVKEFSENLVLFSEIYSSDRDQFYKFIGQEYKQFFVQATNIVSSADSVAVIMQLNEGINDYLILINLFRQLIVMLDSLSSDYWLKLDSNNNGDFAKLIIEQANKAVFEKNQEVIELVEQKSKEFSFAKDEFFTNNLNHQLWTEIKSLEQIVLSKPDGDFEYFKEILSQKEHLADDMVINLWAILAINISYLDYLNNLVNA
ncbi:hypothetical protein SCULI_v1c02250 [Spiroplasma culicicola AES-1]|uniref:Uncharacterized protein n=2 Tax=Spiroplasma culicicola TaxID=216935 RepID=W6A6H3_9MOLU|nr:hypothetical protein SCULI_v1c02250 [Spiroplasma culicicola AES-1]